MDHLNQNRPLLCQTFIGREWELQELKALLYNTTAGRVHICLMSGEAGLGKTRLCQVFVHICRDQQATVLFGEASPHDQMLPFSLFLDLFHRSFDTFGDVSPSFQQALQATFSFLLQFSPDLAALFPALSLPAYDPINTPARHLPVLFHQVLRGLQTLTKVCQRPLIIVLEDLHWADETSLDLLAFLAHRLDMHTPLAETSLPLLILGTYRTEALPDTPALQRLVTHLSAQRQAEHLHLAPLDRSEHRQCVKQILNQSVSEEFAQFLYAWDEGNPFFTEELLSAMLVNGQLRIQSDGWLPPHGATPHLPSSLTAAILERFHRLSDGDQEVLMHAAVIGRVFDFPLLMMLCHIDEYELVQVLRRAIKMQLISALESKTLRANREQERYRFRHALTREAIYEQMLLPERRLRHRTVAETLEQFITNPASDTASPMISLEQVPHLLVEHYSLAALAERGRPYALEAARRASLLGTFREERFYLEVAQASLPQDSPERLPLLERMGIVSMGMFDFPAALHWLSLAREGYLRSGHSSQALQVLAIMLFPAWSLADSSLHRIIAELERGIEVASEQTGQMKRDMHLLTVSSQLTAYQSIQGHYQRIFQLVERNNALFEILTDPQKIVPIQTSNIAYCWARANQHVQFMEECIVVLGNVLTVAHQQGLPHTLIYAYTTLQLLLIGGGQIEEAKQITKEAIAYEELSGLIRSSYPYGLLCFFSGEGWERGIELLGNHIAYLKHKNILGLLSLAEMTLAHLLIARNELLKAQEYLSDAQPILERMNDNLYLLWMGWGFAKLYRAQGNQLQAQKWYEGTLECWQMAEDRLFILSILLDGITFYAHIGNLQQAKCWLSYLQQVTTMTDNPVGEAALLEAQGTLAAKQKNFQPAREALWQAVQAWGTLKFRYQQAVALHRLAEVLLQQTERKSLDHQMRHHLREEAEKYLQQASQVYEQLGIVGQAETVQRLRARSRLDAQQKRRKTLATQRQAEGLTPRELQTLHLVADGRTNNEIARTLGISLGTVELHVTHILAKLNCENRTQAVMDAVSKGWISPSS